MDFSKATVILRGFDYEQVKMIASVLSKSKYIKCMEITMNTPKALEIIEKLNKNFGDELFIGAGTVFNERQLKDVIAAGARFVLSPTKMSKDMIRLCKEAGIVCIPAAFTASEIYEMHEYGADIIKVFPANELSKNYANKIKEPLSLGIKLMAVGGVNKMNLKDYISGGYDFVGSAGGIFDKDDIVNLNRENLEKSLAEFEYVLLSIENNE